MHLVPLSLLRLCTTLGHSPPPLGRPFKDAFLTLPVMPPKSTFQPCQVMEKLPRLFP